MTMVSQQATARAQGADKTLTSVTSVGAMAVAFLASQHHTMHMLVLMAATGSAGVGFMTAYPLVRRTMLLVSLLMAGVTVYQAWGRRWAPGQLGMRVVSGVSAAVTLGLVAWSVLQFGL